MSIKSEIATILNNFNEGQIFEMQDLYDQGLARRDSSGRRMRELREIGWIITGVSGNKYILEKKGAMPTDAEWKSKKRSISLRVRREVLTRDDFRCTLCGISSKDKEITLGHIVPVASGGGNNKENLRAECIDCNEPWRNNSYCLESQAVAIAKEFEDQFLSEIEIMNEDQKRKLIEFIAISIVTNKMN